MKFSQIWRRVDYKFLMTLVVLMVISLLVISSATGEDYYSSSQPFFTRDVKVQIVRFAIGWCLFFLITYLDYRALRSFALLYYLLILVLLVGVLFTPSIHGVRRWYKVPGLGVSFQPSEYAKLAVLLCVSWFLEKKQGSAHEFLPSAIASLLVFIPFVLIFKQPDLGTALCLMPMALAVFYFGGVNKKIVWVGTIIGIALFSFVVMMFLGVIPHEKVKPAALKVVKEYQYERLNPSTYHQKSAQIAIALGHFTGAGWRSSEFTGKKWLPFAHTDSVFPAFTEEFGLIGAWVLLGLFFGLIYFSLIVAKTAKDEFGRLLAVGISVYFAIHVIVNIGMMCGLLPITGVPLILVSSGGSSVLSSMMAAGLLQSIYVRRFMF